MSSPAQTIDQRYVKAIAHPLRHRILLALGDEPSSPSRVAAQLGEPLGRVSHHVRVLVRLGALELVETAHRRGAVEHFYRAHMPRLDDARLSPSARKALADRDLGRVADELLGAAHAGGLDNLRAHVSYTLFDLDEDQLDAVAEVVDDASARIREVTVASAERLARTKSEPLRTQLALLYFGQAGGRRH